MLKFVARKQMVRRIVSCLCFCGQFLFLRNSGVSSNMDLLTNRTLRYSAWLMSFLTCAGNAMVLWGRFTSRDENRSVSLVIRNLAVSDFIMGIYLAIISFQDVRYRESYHTVSSDWLKSWGCTLAGILSMISSEVSILILAFMSIERFLLISDPFGHHRLNTKKCHDEFVRHLARRRLHRHPSRHPVSFVDEVLRDL